ncbi:MAG: hypothetical protein ACJ8AI_02245 [Rhodopila sp.]
MILAFYTSPHLIDLILLFTVLEGFILARWRKISVRTVIVMLLPGLCLLLALRAAMAGAAWPWVPVVLTGALLSHFFDMRERFRRR